MIRTIRKGSIIKNVYDNQTNTRIDVKITGQMCFIGPKGREEGFYVSYSTKDGQKNWMKWDEFEKDWETLI